MDFIDLYDNHDYIIWTSNAIRDISKGEIGLNMREDCN
jgi:hypothetical protein